MTDLQCAARLHVARHGAADHESELVSDSGGWLSLAGRDQSRSLGERLVAERIARVWSSPMSRAVQTAEIAAAVLGVDVVVREGLRELGVGHEVVARYEAVLLEIADEHRGEAVLVVSHGGVMRLALPALARNLAPGHARDLPLGSCDVVALESDADGWLVRSWADRPLA